MARIVTIPTAGVSNAMAAYTIGFARLEVHDRVEDAVGADPERWSRSARCAES